MVKATDVLKGRAKLLRTTAFRFEELAFQLDGKLSDHANDTMVEILKAVWPDSINDLENNKENNEI